MASTKTGRSSGVLSQLLSIGREGEKRNWLRHRGGPRERARVEGLQSGLEGDKRRARAARDEHAMLVLVRRRWGAASLLSSKNVRWTKAAGHVLSFTFIFLD
jgi:hypothetical protein